MFSIIDPVVTERQWRSESPISQVSLCASIDFAQGRSLPVHAWSGEDRDGKPLAVVWVAGKRAGQLFSAFEITGR